MSEKQGGLLSSKGSKLTFLVSIQTGRSTDSSTTSELRVKELIAMIRRTASVASPITLGIQLRRWCVGSATGDGVVIVGAVSGIAADLDHPVRTF